MKITSVDVMRVTSGKGGDSVGNVPWSPVVVRINTDASISGFGEAGICYGNLSNGGYGACLDFGKIILGMDPLNSEAIWNHIHRMTFWGMGGGTAVFSAISAIDIALWDIKGKYFNAPVYQLLGGKTNEKLRAYASQIQFDWGAESHSLSFPEEYAEATRKALAQGYDCVKVDPIGFNMERKWMGWSNYGMLRQEQLRAAVERVAAIREAGGENMDIIIELHALTDVNTAIQLAKELEPYRIFYYEEPTQPLFPRMMREIKEKIQIPIASGERIYSRWGYASFFEDRSLSVIQPDLCNCGGITEGKKICDMAHTFDIGTQIHICGGPISTAAALQLEAVIPNFLIHEQHASALIQENRDTCIYDYQPVNGAFEIPNRPGIGQELTEKAIRTAETITLKL